jgi:acid phosphatase type 7
MSRAVSLALVLAWGLASTAEAAEPTARKGPYVQHVSSSSAVVRVELDAPAAIAVSVAPASADGGPSPTQMSGVDAGADARAPKAFHSVRLDGLQPSTRYAYAVHVGAKALEGAFTTAPPGDSSAPVRFAIYGDNRTDHAAHRKLVSAMAMAPADFFLQTGDLVAVGGDPSQWTTFFELEAPMMRERCIFAAIGNHELYQSTGSEFARYFGPEGAPEVIPDAGPPESAYFASTFRWGPARFFLLNAMVDYERGPDRAWLEKALADADGEQDLTWRIVALHHGPWSSGPHGENARLHRAGVVELLRRHKVDLVLSGHDHLYDRGIVDGMPYVVSGGGGAPLYKVKQARPYSRKSESVHHFVDAVLTRAALAITVTRADGTVVERCGLPKSGTWDCDAPPPPPPPPPAPKSTCGCRVAGEAAGPLPWLGALAVVSAWVARRRRAHNAAAR